MRGYPRDLVGLRFGRLLVLRRSGTASSGHATWACVCDCGTETVVRSHLLVSGETRSCGCLRHDTPLSGRPVRDIAGQRFGRLVAVRIAPAARAGHRPNCVKIRKDG